MKFSHFITASIFVHIIQFLSIFDIYFTSPLVKNLDPVAVSNEKPLAKRLVLFVADGLRADTFFELNETGHTRAPFLRNKIHNGATWGVSHTHIPTESRPGHVALIAGFYEDVSAVMKGWKENPVEFDSFFNRSKELWAWGSQDIVTMFERGTTRSHMHPYYFANEYISIIDRDPSKLDTWVLDRVTGFFQNASKHKELRNSLNQGQIVLFLHFSGLDTNGHSHKPMSREYKENVNVVDEIIKNVTSIIDSFYENDEKTVYIFTADHGMTDWGTHGASHVSETETPFLVWGSGVSFGKMKRDRFKKKQTTRQIMQSRAWKLNLDSRVDIEQADNAPLMAALIGVPFPVNSVGVLPVDYLSCNDERKAKLLLENAQQISNQFIVKMKSTKNHVLSFLFKPFPELPLSNVESFKNDIKNLISVKNFKKAMTKSQLLIDLSLKGLRYYHTYHRLLLYSCTILSFVGWMIVACFNVVKEFSLVMRQKEKLVGQCNNVLLQKCIFSVFVISIIIVIICITYLNLPRTFYIYCSLPFIVWYNVVKEYLLIKSTLQLIKQNPQIAIKLFLYIIIGIIGIWCLVGSFFYRYILSIELFIFCLLPYLTANCLSIQIKVLWSIFCLIISVFPALPVVSYGNNSFLVLLAGVLISLGCVYLQKIDQRCNPKIYTQLINTMPVLSSIICFITSHIENVPMLFHVFSWYTLFCSWLMPLLESTNFPIRLNTVFVWLSSVYMLLSLSYEALFFGVFFCLLFTWIHIEYSITKSESNRNQLKNLYDMDFSKATLLIGDNDYSREPNFHDMRRSYMLVFFLVLAFFGVGNIASVNSFDVRVVFPFLTIEYIPVMAALLAYKVFLPYLLLVCSFSAIALATRIPFRLLCCIVMVISDIMSIHFVFLVQDYGSWLDIGTSISHFVIAMSMTLALLLFFVVSRLLTAGKLLSNLKNFKTFL